MTFLKQMRDEALKCSEELPKFKLRQAADALDMAIKLLYMSPTKEAMVAVNGAWAHAELVLRVTREGNDDGPTAGGLKDPAQLAIAA